MDRFNNGIIYTNDNCIACNKCISQCSILGANVCSVHNGKRIISVNDAKCNHCGHCVNLCVHNARDFLDDTDNFFEDLKNGKDISLIVDQTFYIYFAEKALNVIAYLKSIGVKKIYDVAYGAEISLWAHVKYLYESQDLLPSEKAFIANTCSSFINEVELYNPALRYKLIPVQSPVFCTAIYARKYLGDNNKIAFLGSCVAKKVEFENPKNEDYINYNLTYSHFSKYVDYSVLSNQTATADLKSQGVGNVLCGEGVFRDFVSKYFPSKERLLVYNSIDNKIFNQLNFFLSDEYAKNQPFMAEIYACEHNCQIGPGFANINLDYPYIYSSFDNIYKKCASFIQLNNQDYEKNRNDLFEQFEELDYEDFKRLYVNRFRQPYHIPQNVYEDIYEVMLKNTEEKRRINCGACGYSSCHEMAKAIAYGYNKKENCLHYMNDVMEKNYYTEVLTGLDNRRGIIRKVNQIISQNVDRTYAVYTGDINRLKVINDIFGYEVGNSVIKFIAKTLCDVVGDKGVVGCFGGGSFCIFVEHDIETLELIRNIKFFDCRPLGVEMPVTIRFGVFISENIEDTFMDMLGYSTLCMDRAISTTHNTFSFFTKEFRENMVREVEVTSQMPVAINNEEFTLWFQPQYKTGTGELVGAESLCRWVKIDGTIIRPDSFIPIAEKNGFIVTLDKVIWRKAFQTLRNWIDAGYNPVPIAINISRVSLETDSLIYTIKRLDEEFKIPHHLIHFEITESASMNDTASLIERINKIREMGYLIAMDDFGSGYSSLNSLKDFPIDMLKLDMGFLKTESNMDKGGNVIASVVHMAQSLKLITIAEGVETAAQANFLTSIGCDVIQGFLYSKPIPENQFIKLLQKDRSEIQIKQPVFYGNININEFYDPNSSENYMFETYSGPSAIFEFNELEYRAKLIRINTKCLKLFNAESFSVSEITNSLRDLFNTQTRSSILEAMQQVLETKTEQYCELECRGFENQVPIWIRINFWILSSNGNVHTMYASFTDVTEAKITENTLKVVNAQLNRYSETSAIGLLMLHMHIDPKHPFETLLTRVLKWDSQFEKLSGFTKAEIQKWTDKDVMNNIYPLDRPRFKARMLAGIVRKFEKPVHIVYRVKHKDGHYLKVKAIIYGVYQEKNSFFLTTNYVILNDKENDVGMLPDNEA